MSFWRKILRWIMELLHIEPSAVRLGKKIFMPLAYEPYYDGGNISWMWNYLNKTNHGQKDAREVILRQCNKDETPAIVFILTPTNEAGNIFDNFPNEMNKFMLDKAVAAIKECVWAGIAVFPCLYVDDKAPWFYDIEKHQEVWRKIHEAIGRYVSGYVLSIESNEQCRTVSALQHYIHIMKQCMPGKIYGTHLQWRSKGVGGYRWIGGTSTPSNADFVLAEFSWNVHTGDNAGVAGVNGEVPEMKATSPMTKIAFIEFNGNAVGETFRQQREAIRSHNPWGVG